MNITWIKVNQLSENRKFINAAKNDTVTVFIWQRYLLRDVKKDASKNNRVNHLSTKLSMDEHSFKRKRNVKNIEPKISRRVFHNNDGNKMYHTKSFPVWGYIMSLCIQLELFNI